MHSMRILYQNLLLPKHFASWKQHRYRHGSSKNWSHFSTIKERTSEVVQPNRTSNDYDKETQQWMTSMYTKLYWKLILLNATILNTCVLTCSASSEMHIRVNVGETAPVFSFRCDVQLTMLTTEISTLTSKGVCWRAVLTIVAVCTGVHSSIQIPCRVRVVFTIDDLFLLKVPLSLLRSLGWGWVLVLQCSEGNLL